MDPLVDTCAQRPLRPSLWRELATLRIAFFVAWLTPCLPAASILWLFTLALLKGLLVFLFPTMRACLYNLLLDIWDPWVDGGFATTSCRGFQESMKWAPCKRKPLWCLVGEHQPAASSIKDEQDLPGFAFRWYCWPFRNTFWNFFVISFISLLGVLSKSKLSWNLNLLNGPTAHVCSEADWEIYKT